MKIKRRMTNTCLCGCGGEIKNGNGSQFLRGHHMRGINGVHPQINITEQECACGCGQIIEKPYKDGRIIRFKQGHHRKGKAYTLEQRMERITNRYNRDPIFSPYLTNVFVCFDKIRKRWTCSTKDEDGNYTNKLHANAVYKHYYGEMPEGYVVHHKNKKHEDIEDDRPENLMLLPKDWNLRIFPVLAKGFGVHESVITNAYLKVFSLCQKPEVTFIKLCEVLVTQKSRENEEIERAKAKAKSKGKG